jgi:hypothetical protein
MVDYDINDYKEKTELTASKLFTSVMSSIRTFGHLQTMESYRRAVDVLGRLNAQVFAAADTHTLAQALLAQLTALELFSGIDCRTGSKSDVTTCATGTSCNAQAQHALLQLAHESPGTVVSDEGLYGVCLALKDGDTLALCMAAARPLTPAALHVLGLWAQSATLAVTHWSAMA